MTKVSNKTSSQQQKKGNPLEPSSKLTKTRRNVAQVVSKGMTYTLEPKVPESLKSKPILTKNRQTSFYDESIDPFAESILTDSTKLQTPNINSSETTPNLLPVNIVGDGIGIVPLSDEEANLPLGVPVVYVEENNEYYATYSMEQAAAILEVEQFIVKKWVESGKVVGFVNKNGEMRVPKAQIRDGRIAPFLDKLTHIYEKPTDLWQYLVTEKLVQNELIRPLDVHFQEDLGRVLDLSVSLRMDFT